MEDKDSVEEKKKGEQTVNRQKKAKRYKDSDEKRTKTAQKERQN